MDSISNTFKLLGNSWTAIKKDKEILLVPVIGYLIISAILVPLGFYLYNNIFVQGDLTQVNVGAIFIFLVISLSLYFVSVLVKATVIAMATERFAGGDPNLKSGFKKSFSRILPLIGWALVTMTVGTILSAIRSRTGVAGAILTGLAGFSWSVATFFVIPVILFENKGTFSAIKQSTALLKKSWRGNLTSRFAIGILYLVAAGISALIGYLISLANIPTGVFTGVIIFSILALGLSVLEAIFVAALYDFINGKNVEAFPSSDLQKAFQSKE